MSTFDVLPVSKTSTFLLKSMARVCVHMHIKHSLYEKELELQIYSILVDVIIIKYSFILIFSPFSIRS